MRASYRKLSILYHPDKNPDPRAQFDYMKIRRAFDALTSPVQRDVYTFMGERALDVCKQCATYREFVGHMLVPIALRSSIQLAVGLVMLFFSGRLYLSFWVVLWSVAVAIVELYGIGTPLDAPPQGGGGARRARLRAYTCEQGANGCRPRRRARAGSGGDIAAHAVDPLAWVLPQLTLSGKLMIVQRLFPSLTMAFTNIYNLFWPYEQASEAAMVEQLERVRQRTAAGGAHSRIDGSVSFFARLALCPSLPPPNAARGNGSSQSRRAAPGATARLRPRGGAAGASACVHLRRQD